jgi:tetratricopeptide (TPR) repeat protein
MEKVDTEHLAAAFAFTAIPARYALERRQWGEAAELNLHPRSLSWQKFPQAESILWFARGVGAARGGNVASARGDLARLEALRDTMTAAKNTYWADQAEIQRLAVAGWIARGEGRNDDALALLRRAADAEGATEKHPVTPGAIHPAREMLGELLLELGQPAQALAEFEASQRTDPNRFHELAGAARAAELAGDQARARRYYRELVTLARQADSERPELKRAKAFLNK